jgi:hypothetical protein
METQPSLERALRHRGWWLVQAPLKRASKLICVTEDEAGVLRTPRFRLRLMRRYTERDHRAPLTTTIIEDLRKTRLPLSSPPHSTTPLAKNSPQLNLNRARPLRDETGPLLLFWLVRRSANPTHGSLSESNSRL